MSGIEYILISGGCIDKNIVSSYVASHKIAKIIAIDKGIETLYDLKIEPDYILGDFDSVDKDIYIKFIQMYEKANILRFNSRKDYTDTELGIRNAIDHKANKITLFGGTGTRIDHMLANIRTLYLAHEQGIFAQIIDSNNRIYLAEGNVELYKNDVYGKYISVLPYKEDIKDITMKGFKYEIENAIMPYGASLGVSNEIIEDKAIISSKEGIFIIIESND